MDRVFTCLNDMGGFLDSNLTQTPTFLDFILNPMKHVTCIFEEVS
jgi:hypothetical protein